MPKSSKPSVPNPPKGRAGRRTGPEQLLWEELKGSGHYPVITKVIRQNASHGGINVLRTLNGRTVSVEGGDRKIGPKTISRFLTDGGGIGWNYAKVIAANAGTNLEILVDDILTTAKREKRTAKSTELSDDSNINTLADRCYMTIDRISIVPSAEIAEAVVADTDHPAAIDALSMVRSLDGFSAATVESSFPTIGKILENDTGRSIFQRLDPLDDPALNDIFFQMLKPFWPTATRLICWADFLPCSWETPEFMRAHHLGLFKSIAGTHFTADDASVIAESYNQIGDKNRDALHSKLASSEFKYEVYLSKDTIMKMVRRQAPFQEISFKMLGEQAVYLEELYHRYGNRLCVRQLTTQGDNVVRDQASHEGMDSIFVLLRDQPVHSANRTRRGHMEIIGGEKRLNRYQDLFQRLDHCSHDLTLKDLAQLLRGETPDWKRLRRQDNS
jgi:hypothetical protein